MSRSSDSWVASVFAQFYNSFGEKWPCLAVEHIYAKHDGKNIFAEVSETWNFSKFSSRIFKSSCWRHMRLKHKRQKYSDKVFENISLRKICLKHKNMNDMSYIIS